MTGRDPYQTALRALAGFADEGRFGWGRPLIATALADELGLSPTPVREALARLAGEGMLEHRPGRGYFSPSPTTSDIVDLYEMHRRLAHWALDLLHERQGSAPSEGSDLTPVEAFYERLVALAQNDVLACTHRRIVVQLRPIRRIEAEIRPAADEQVAQLEQLFGDGRLVALRKAVDVYHHDRSEAARYVFSVMRRASKSIAGI